MLVHASIVNAMPRALLLLLLICAQSAPAQLSGERTAAGCIRVQGSRDDPVRVTADGRLTLERFPGPPNYESIARGDAEERAFILELPQETCIDDGGDFTDTEERFVMVQLGAVDETTGAALHEAVGRRVRVSGEGFGAQTSHHHASLIMMVDEVGVR
jgi:hypothetical protein